jgi:hypothetical protein
MEKEKKRLREQVGDYLIDISKLSFGGVILSLILEMSQNKPLLLVVGIMATFGVALWGFILSNSKK